MNPDMIRQTASAFQRSRILLSGFELDLFTHIDDSGTTSGQISKQLNLNEPACARLMNALVSLGFLEKKDHLFFNTPESFTFLSKKSPGYQGGLGHTGHLWHTWSHLTEVVRTGKAAHSDDINDRGDDWLTPFIHAMHDRAMKQAPAQLGHTDLSGVTTMLDVGGGSGAFSMEFIRRKPEIKATVFDLPAVVPITKQFVEKEGFAGKITTHTGDYTADELPGGFDLVFLSAVIHSNSLGINAELIRKCYSSLNPGGTIMIQDWIMNNDRTEPAAGAVFSINMLVGTEEGDCYTEQEVTAMLSSAGFKNISRRELDLGLSQVTARKT